MLTPKGGTKAVNTLLTATETKQIYHFHQLFNALNPFLMRHLQTIFTLALALVVSTAFAQVKESEKLMSQGSKSSLSIDLSKTDVKFAEKIWREFTKTFGGKYLGRDKKTDEYMTDNALIAGIGGANTVDIYMKYTPMGENVTATVWFDMGGAYVNSTEFKEKYAEAEKIMLRYGIEVARAQTKIQLEEQQEAAKKLDKNMRSLERDNANLHDDIEGWKKKIAKAEGEIQNNLKSQEDVKNKIIAQKKVIDEVQKKLDTLN
jgi:hypothetical protein